LLIPVLLDNLIYLNARKAEGKTIKEIISGIRDFKEFSSIRIHSKLKNAAKTNEEFARLILLLDSQNMKNRVTGKRLYKEGGLKAAFYGDPESGKIFVAYKGTGEGEWIDNGTGLGGVAAYTRQQEEARLFFKNNIKKARALMKNKEAKAIISGHSKGGNKAQFTTATTAGDCEKCVSFDGQSMSTATMRYMIDKLSGAEFFKIRREKLFAVRADNDYVSPLGKNLGNEYYNGQRLPSLMIPDRNTTFYQSTLRGVEWHCPDAILTPDGKLTKLANQGEVSKTAERLSEKVMALEASERVKATVTAMWALQAFYVKTAPITGEKPNAEDILKGIELINKILEETSKETATLREKNMIADARKLLKNFRLREAL
jgi:hypothetical protein